MSEFVRTLHMMLLGRYSEFMWGLNMIWILPVVAEVLLLAAKASNRTPPTGDTQSPIGIEEVAAAATAYGYYIASALMVGAQFPGFLRDHLFDGFAPAALVGFLIYRIHGAQVRLSKIALLYLQSATVFGLIAAAAIFTSGKDNFVPVLYAALIGGFMFPLMVRAAKSIAQSIGEEGERRNDAVTVSEQHGVGAGTQPAAATEVQGQPDPDGGTDLGAADRGDLRDAESVPGETEPQAPAAGAHAAEEGAQP
jgi:hypothetical protein